MRILVFLFTLPYIAAGPTAALAGTARDRFSPGIRVDQRVDGPLGLRMALHAEELARQMQRAAQEGGERLGVLIEAGTLLCEVTNCGPVREALPGAVQALIRRSGEWRDAAAFRRGLSGLLAYFEATGDRKALEAARRAGDAASRVAPEWRDPELGTGPLAGPAATLFSHTGERRRLTQGISPEMAEEGAPRLLRALWTKGRLEGSEHARAEEVLATLAGLVELYRLTGQAAFLRGAQRGWEEIASRHLYVTGAVGARGRLRSDGALPGEASASVGEPDVTGEWLRLNLALLRATGEVKYADEIERAFYNHLLALQDGRTGAWAPSAPLIGRRKYGAPGNERGAGAALALSIAAAAFRGSLDGAPAVVLYVPGEARLPVATGGGEKRVKLLLETNFPESGFAVLRVAEGGAGRYAIHLRVPGWCPQYTVTAGRTNWSGRAGEWLRVERDWREGDELHIRMEMAVRTLEGKPSYPGQVALQRGPQVLALEAAANPGVSYLHRVALDSTAAPRLIEAPGRAAEGRARQAYAVAGTAVSWTGGRTVAARTRLVLIPFSEAREYRVWLPVANRLPIGPVALTAFAEEAWSADGLVDGSICDERADTFRTASSDGKEGSWFAIELSKPEWVERIVYRHGRIMPDGGWFDTSRGKPLVQVKRTADGPWETVGRLETYPASNGKAPPALYEGQAFEVRLPVPLRVVAIRVLGEPGGRFSSCAELAAYGPGRDTGWAGGGTRRGPIHIAQSKR